jgi:hypothetical protein
MSNKNDWHKMIGSTNKKAHPTLLLIRINNNPPGELWQDEPPNYLGWQQSTATLGNMA